MVVCKFFQQGSCRYGQSCRFEHIYSSKYSYHAAVPSQPSQPAGVADHITDEQLTKQVQLDVKAALEGDQWLLSCYAPFKKCIPGLTDLSPEEARLFMYESKSNNTMSAAIQYMDNIVAATRSKYEQLLQPTNFVRTLRALYNGETVTSPFSNQPSTNAYGPSTASSLFRGAVNIACSFRQNNADLIFGQNNNVFAQSNDTSPKSIFAQASQSAFGSPNAQQNVFGSPNSQQPASVFSQSTDSAKSLFAQASQNVFGQANQASPSSIFAAAQNTFFNQQSPSQNNADPFVQKMNDPFGQEPNTNSIYSKAEDLSPESLEAYKSDQFTLGFIPELPPPRELCI